MAGHFFWYAKNWHSLMPMKTISKTIVESNKKLITYQVHGSPWNSGAKYTFVKWMMMAPMPCFDVSYHHVSQDRRTFGGSRNRFAEKSKQSKSFHSLIKKCRSSDAQVLNSILRVRREKKVERNVSIGLPIKQVKAKPANRPCNSQPMNPVNASLLQWSSSSLTVFTIWDDMCAYGVCSDNS